MGRPVRIPKYGAKTLFIQRIYRSALANPRGIAVLVETAGEDGIDIAAAMQSMKNAYERAFRILLAHPALFESARTQFHIATLPRRSWEKRNGMPKCAVDVREAVIGDLASNLSTYYLARQGRGGNCWVDYSHRAGVASFFAYLPLAAAGSPRAGSRPRATRRPPFRKQVSLLRQRMKALFPIEGEPIIFEKTSGAYRCTFNVFLESDCGYPTPAGLTWRDFRFEALPGGRLRVGVTAREIFQAKTRSRGSNRLSSETAERALLVWREYPLELLDLTTAQGMPNQEGLVLLALLRNGGELARSAHDIAALRLGRRLREWTGLPDELFPYGASKAIWVAKFECGAQEK